ncbi:uncharacterized protein B0H64DRAFT_439050 [Chaetomium fimeti]|uniref:Uncharacterized protein n=1 Tax=Chaetomium fimeti TaxID=1854472 RepID=A0AAE0HL73_9PEZI|nr:hypothetical protein B0H64DRAFT_439050 [Chaetomium fimeti]
MAPAKTNHGSGDVGGQPSAPEQHGPPATQQTEHDYDSISLPQTPDTAQRARGLTDHDHPDTDISSGIWPAADLAAADDTPTAAAASPLVPFLVSPNSPPRRDARLTPSPPPRATTGPLPPTHWGPQTTAWLQVQDAPIGWSFAAGAAAEQEEEWEARAGYGDGDGHGENWDHAAVNLAGDDSSPHGPNR